MANIQADVEAARDRHEYLGGFVDFSEFIASDFSLSIYRKFRVLGARNLLYLQAELQLLECQLKAVDEEDKRTIAWSNDEKEALDTEKAARSWDFMKEQANGGDEKQAGKLRMIYKLRKLMKEYGGYDSRRCSQDLLTQTEEALLRHNQVLQLEKPESGPFKAFKAWFRRTPPVLWGSGFLLLHDESDMIALGSQVEPDRLSAFMHRCCGYRLRQRRDTPKSWGPVYYYHVERVDLIVGIMSVLASAALLVGAIVSLYYIHPMGIRLAIVGIFTILFAASITLLTHARRIEVYGATAAYVPSA
jgi:hypothetical protein